MKLTIVVLVALALACGGCAADKGAKKEDNKMEEPKNGTGEQPAWSKFPMDKKDTEDKKEDSEADGE